MAGLVRLVSHPPPLSQRHLWSQPGTSLHLAPWFTADPGDDQSRRTEIWASLTKPRVDPPPWSLISMTNLTCLILLDFTFFTLSGSEIHSSKCSHFIDSLVKLDQVVIGLGSMSLVCHFSSHRSLTTKAGACGKTSGLGNANFLQSFPVLQYNKMSANLTLTTISWILMVAWLSLSSSVNWWIVGNTGAPTPPSCPKLPNPSVLKIRWCHHRSEMEKYECMNLKFDKLWLTGRLDLLLELTTLKTGNKITIMKSNQVV